ncbi:hypothetical protein FJ492_14145 [Mesorhizobium sp. B2-5-4]|uniref:hypothetical protein n=1 Tax=unclassified Mesorhizobium TaxID=325217 RepID=UPI00112D0519|nr:MULTISPECIES: hypothetical protein [unclassified Mesorhizobium]TPJ41513.1 hypothetical protein FJ432_13285 [Mesorhizobium sp. B2-6-5]TPJ84670.1 hypothetical protein FJ434_16865 [Mesorhizobium sp. B2-5-13]TPK43852.1 hypothetical protein FJ492_14145 [Mesorhizobium sp. B2-5-4]TPK50816.1 hypothetical protein FJ560_10935 [Mesorhizobium sp. B2-5-5]TPL85343.1 hypothetical protein FJ941_08385 [Mesorhizobium sp. B2-3-13]
MSTNPEPTNVATSVDAILDELQDSPFPSMQAAIAILRKRTGTERSDADLKGLITKKAAVRGIQLFDEGSTAN